MPEQLIMEEYHGLFETPMMRKLREQGLEQGLQQGREEGREQERMSMLVHLLQKQLGPLDEATREQVRHLPADHHYALFDAAFAFTSMADLTDWLAAVGNAEKGAGE